MRIAAPLRTLAQRGAFLLLLLSAGAIMLFGKADPDLFERTRTQVTDMMAPLLTVIAQPIATGAQMVSEAEALINLREDNVRLKMENARLLEWQATARRFAVENRELRKLLSYRPDASVSYVTARVIGDKGGAFLRSILINEGEDGGVKKGQAALTGKGLLGRVESVGQYSARILLITDLNSRVPVVVEKTRVRAILAGDNSRFPRLEFLSANSQLAVGQRIVTSGHGDAFPPGIPVGVITSVGDTGVRVEAFADSDRLEFVRIVDYGLRGILSTASNEPEATAR